jgi:hypothetical protein
MNHLVLEQLFKACSAPDVTAGSAAIKQLEHLIEKHTTKRLEEAAYKELFSQQPELQDLLLASNDVTRITWFLFYLLMNYPDRSAATARCLVKCYNKSMIEGACQAIEVYWQKCDETTCYLTDVITHAGSFEEFGDRVLTLFRQLKQDGLPETRKVMGATFAYYKKFYGFIE